MKNFSTRVYIARTEKLSDNALFEKLYKSLPYASRQKIDALALKKDKRLSLAAEVLLKKALFDLGITEYEIEKGPHGKPRLKGGDVFFNLSHSGDRAMCAVSCKEVGCDVEKIANARLSVAKRYFCPAEYAVLEAAAEDERQQLFYRLWTLKESYVKALGGGLSIALNSFEVRIENDAAFVADNSGREKLYFKEFYFNDGYRYAVCGLSDVGEAEFVNLD